MRSALALLLQFLAPAYGPPPPITPGVAAPVECPDQSAGEIVVCARRTDQQAYRYTPPSRPDGGRDIARDGIKGPGGTTIKGSSFVNGMGTTAAGVKFVVPF
jgi:hypothetical protein